MNIYPRVRLIVVPDGIRKANHKIREDYLNLKFSEVTDEIKAELGFANNRNQTHPPILDEVSPGVEYRITYFCPMACELSNERREQVKQALKGGSEKEAPSVDGISKIPAPHRGSKGGANN